MKTQADLQATVDALTVSVTALEERVKNLPPPVVVDLEPQVTAVAALKVRVDAIDPAPTPAPVA